MGQRTSAQVSELHERVTRGAGVACRIGSKEEEDGDDTSGPRVDGKVTQARSKEARNKEAGKR